MQHKTVTILLRIRVRGQFVMSNTKYHEFPVTVLDNPQVFCFQPVLYLEKNWMADEFAGGCYVGTFPPGVLTSYGK